MQGDEALLSPGELHVGLGSRWVLEKAAANHMGKLLLSRCEVCCPGSALALGRPRAV